MNEKNKGDKKEENEPAINAKSLEEINDLKSKIETLIQDKYSLSIFAEIFINKGITAKELQENKYISMKKSLIYAKLKELEELDLVKIGYKVNPVENGDKGTHTRAYAQKTYTIDYQKFFDLTQLLNESSKQVKLHRISQLFYYYGLQSFVNREISILLNTTDEEFYGRVSSKIQKIKIENAVAFMKEDIFDLYQKKFYNLMEELKDKAQQVYSKEIQARDIEKLLSPYMIFYGSMYLPELDNQLNEKTD